MTNLTLKGSSYRVVNLIVYVARERERYIERYIEKERDIYIYRERYRERDIYREI